MKDKAKPMLAKFEKLRDNEPLFLGKNQWRQDKQQALDRYNAVKAEHDGAYNKQILQIQSMQKRIADEPSAQNPQPQPVKSAQNLTKIGGILPKSENLVQDHHQNTLKNARRATVEPRKKKNGTM